MGSLNMISTLLAPFKVDKEQQALTQTEHKLISEKAVNCFTKKLKDAILTEDFSKYQNCINEALNNRYNVNVNSCGMCYSFRNGALISISQI